MAVVTLPPPTPSVPPPPRPPDPAPTTALPPPAAAVPDGGRRAQRRRWAVAAIGVAVVVAAVAGVVAWRSADDDAGPGFRSQPDERWSTDLGGTMLQLVTDDETAYVIVHDDGGADLVAVDLADGEERWSTALDDSDQLGYGFLGLTDQGIVTDYSSYSEPSGELAVYDPTSGEEISRIDADVDSGWAVLEGDVLVDYGTGLGFAVLDAVAGELRDEVRADEFDLAGGEIYLRTGRRIVMVDDRTLQEGGFEFEADADVLAFAAVDNGLVVATADGLVGVDREGREVWAVDPDVGTVAVVTPVGERTVLVSGETGTVVVRIGSGDAEVAHRETVPYRILAVDRGVDGDTGRDVVVVGPAPAEPADVDAADFEPVEVQVVDLADAGWEVRSTIGTRNTYGRPFLQIDGSVVYADETEPPLDEGGEPTGAGRYVAYDLDSGDELWTLDEPDARYVVVRPDDLLVVVGGSSGDDLLLLS